MAKAAIDAYFVCGGKYHDIDYARLQLLALLGEHERIRTRMAEDYRDIDAIRASDFLVTYTVDVVPDEATALQLRDYVASGKRWLALHGTNSILRYAKGRGWEAPRDVAHVHGDARQPVRRASADRAVSRRGRRSPDHPLVAGIEPFDADDELYLSELHPPLRGRCCIRAGPARRKVSPSATGPSDEPRPVMYLKQVGAGEVLYLTLGHARGHYDMRPLMDEYPQVERGSWNVPAFQELLRRGLRWAARLD